MSGSLLDHVVVSAQLRAKDTVNFFGAGGKKYHRYITAGRVGTQGLDDLKAGGVWQTHIKNDQVERGGDVRRQSLAPQQNMTNAETLAAQGIKEGVGDGLFVFNKEYFQGLH